MRVVLRSFLGRFQLSWINWFVAKGRHLFTSDNVSGQAGPVAVVCNCPNCGHVVMTTFLATKDRLEAVNSARDVSSKRSSSDLSNGNSAKYADSDAADILRERREAREAREKRPLYRTRDQDLRDQPDL
jgi:hypothetical protein